MISDCQKSTDLFALGKQVDHENCYKEVVARLRIFFQEKLKQYVGEYYLENGHPGPMQEIEDGQLRQRWDLGSAFVKDFVSPKLNRYF